MLKTIRQEVTIQPDGLITFRFPELPPGGRAEVIVILKEISPPSQRGLLNFRGKGKGAFASPEEADAFIRGGRDQWEN